MEAFSRTEIELAIKKAEKKHGRLDMNYPLLELFLEKLQSKLPEGCLSPAGEHARFALNECKIWKKPDRVFYSSAAAFAFKRRADVKREAEQKRGARRETKKPARRGALQLVRVIQDEKGQYEWKL
jgi:hypothetical protein